MDNIDKEYFVRSAFTVPSYKIISNVNTPGFTPTKPKQAQKTNARNFSGSFQTAVQG